MRELKARNIKQLAQAYISSVWQKWDVSLSCLASEPTLSTEAALPLWLAPPL